MHKELAGYVIYYKNSDKEIPFAVVSKNFECQAISNCIPAQIKIFLVQIKNKRFFKHKGVDVKGISRVLFKNVKAGKIIQRGSTITQQLARNILKDNK